MEDLHERRDTPSIDARGIRPPPAFTVEAAPPVAGIVVLELGGELDLAATPVLRARLENVGAARAMIVDLAQVTFLDSGALKELLRARGELSVRGVRFVLAGVPDPVRRLLDLTRTSELFEDAPDAATAVRRLSA